MVTSSGANSGSEAGKLPPVEVEVHIFPCGHGDTILVRLADGSWVLIDCYLPENNGTRQRFFTFLAARDINHLAAVFLTHPDHDHFLGMAEVLGHFMQPGRTIGFFCDGGVCAKEVGAIFNGKPGQKAWLRLWDAVSELRKQNKSKHREVNEDSRPVPVISAPGYQKRCELVPIGPQTGRRRELFTKSVKSLAANPGAKLEANALSIIMMLSLSDADKHANVLLAADADIAGLDHALAVWSERAAESSQPVELDGVKVPHHGSIENHGSFLVNGAMPPAGTRIAAISAGDRTALPDRRVLRDYLANGWNVLLTRRRAHKRALNRAFDLVNRSVLIPTADNHVILRWSRDRGLTWEPKEASIDSSDLPAYEEATT